MKAKCADNGNLYPWLTVGKTYDVLIKQNGKEVVFIDDDGDANEALANRFQLLPDAPETEWMRTWSNGESSIYVNINRGVGVTFDGATHSSMLWSLHNALRDENECVNISKEYADAFAALVGHDWGKE